MTRSTDKMLADRARLLGPNVSTFYEDLVHFVKGEGRLAVGRERAPLSRLLQKRA